MEKSESGVNIPDPQHCYIPPSYATAPEICLPCISWWWTPSSPAGTSRGVPSSSCCAPSLHLASKSFSLSGRANQLSVFFCNFSWSHSLFLHFSHGWEYCSSFQSLSAWEEFFLTSPVPGRIWPDIVFHCVQRPSGIWDKHQGSYFKELSKNCVKNA